MSARHALLTFPKGQQTQQGGRTSEANANAAACWWQPVWFSFVCYLERGDTHGTKTMSVHMRHAIRNC